MPSPLPSSANAAAPPADQGVLIFGHRIFYGWWTVLAALVLGALAGGVFVHGFTTFVTPLKEEFNVGSGVISLAFSLTAFVEAFMGPFQGMVIDRIGPRRVALIGITLLGVGFVAVSFSTSIVVFIALFVGVLAPGVAMGTFHPPSATVGNWFVRRRGLALALASIGFGVGGFLVPLVQFFIDSYGWRDAARILGVGVLLIGYPAAMFLRHRPEQHGMYPDGASGPPADSLPISGRDSATEFNYTLKEALKTRSFWMLAGSFSMRMFVVASMSVHFIPIMEDKGQSAVTAATMLSIFAATTIPVRFSLGFVMDILPKNLVSTAMTGFMIVAIVVLYRSTEIWHLYLFLILYSIGWAGSGANMITAIRGEYFGRLRFATIGGTMSMVMVFGTAGGPTWTGFSFDRTNSYNVAFFTFIAMLIGSAVLMFFAKRPIPEGKARRV